MIIAKGAEAEIHRDGDAIIKERISKGYRIKEIDETLRKRRTSTEAKLLREARRAGVATPQILEEDKFSIKMEFIDGIKIRDAINEGNVKEIAEKIGTAVGKLHSYNIIHGDLTTSNMILKGEEMFLIDFGLGFISQRDEDKANDLFLLKEIIKSTHFEVKEEMWTAFLESYLVHYQGAEIVIKTLSEVEKRGRYKLKEKG